MLFGVLQDPESICQRDARAGVPPAAGDVGRPGRRHHGRACCRPSRSSWRPPRPTRRRASWRPSPKPRRACRWRRWARWSRARAAAFSPSLGRFVQDLLRRASDGSIANFIACEVRGGHGSSPRLADAFCGLAPEPNRRSAILALARDSIEQQGGAADPGAGPGVAAVRRACCSPTPTRPFVSDEYNVELGRAHRARRGPRQGPHGPGRGHGRRGAPSVDDEQRAAARRETHRRSHEPAAGPDAVAGPRRPRARTRQPAPRRRRLPGRRAAGRGPAVAGREPSRARDPLGSRRRRSHNFLTPSTMRHVASHLDTSDARVVEAARRFCLALGTVAIRPLAEVLSREERNRPRKHLIDVLTGFGAAGRQAVESLRQSPNAAVRRTAVLLLREFGGQDALPELESLLDDAEPHVQREATRAIATLGIDSAYDTLIRALERGTERARTSILGRPLDAAARRRGAGAVASGRQGALPRRDVGRARAGRRAPRRRRRPDGRRRAGRGAAAPQRLVAVPHAAPAPPGHRRAGADRQARGRRASWNPRRRPRPRAVRAAARARLEALAAHHSGEERTA